jgi:hypothetical protein
MRPEEATGPKTWNADVEESKCLIMNPSLPVGGFENIYLNVLTYCNVLESFYFTMEVYYTHSSIHNS